jgi:hypothetical protein
MHSKTRYFLPLVLLSLLSLTGCDFNRGSFSADRAMGDQIIVALERYKSEKGSYPDVLWTLEPDYIGQIIPPRYGQQRWDYTHYCKNDSFGLAVWGRKLTDDGYVYFSERKQWEVAHNSF